ncbi:MAG: SCO1664 family protein [Candidatus Limnocylindrales bacterium]
MVDHVTTLDVLAAGEIEIVGRIVGSSNNALFVRLTRDCPDPEPAQVIEAVYKPTLGERPLDDFPDGTLTRREVAAWHVSEALAWDIVPPTVLRDGPFGEGMVQAFIEADPAVDVVALVVEDDPRLRHMAVFDAAINNTDRKGGHILPIGGGLHVHGVDHGVTFSAVPKLRTVLWGWRGQPLAPDEVAGLERLRHALGGGLGGQLRTLLSAGEVRATARRVDALLTSGMFPFPSPTWPAVPWPPF